MTTLQRSLSSVKRKGRFSRKQAKISIADLLAPVLKENRDDQPSTKRLFCTPDLLAPSLKGLEQVWCSGYVRSGFIGLALLVIALLISNLFDKPSDARQ
ncbi:hypothetical protein [Ktedonobacter sp. SOSP1-52]|uniref:hypothetical protein n=1 Tax=Ktedonobacter sp. SOSP1-52 TaxID=2778366 RepID=UPI00191662C0|nr:hypothetical protein [Ktedonobacter sp. SOSP1-52]